VNTPLTLRTEQDPVVPRQLTVEDAPAYFAAVDANRDHLSQFGDETAAKYPDIQSVVNSIATPSNPDKIRMGIWDGDTFVGSANLTPDEDGHATEIGYWLDARHQGHGYATVAARALAIYGQKQFGKVYAHVSTEPMEIGDRVNDKSVSVLERVGFKRTAREAGRLVYELARKPSRHIKPSETEYFDRGGFEGHVYVPKEAGEGFNALVIDVHGRHPEKRILAGNTRSYFVIDGSGTFVVDGEVQEAEKGDLLVIEAGSVYQYEGSMQLFEFNVSPDNSFGDQKLE
jgi:RimJ/RimL family protein N-acetyltransferase/mannose-6-phosphate isomerase-like protein (cupin superfamily)